NASWLSGFRLFVYNEAGRLFIQYGDRGASPLSVYELLLPLHDTFQALRIEAKHGTRAPRVLILCEVEVYVEAACQWHTYGLECEHQCHCSGSQRCSMTTGTCEFTPDYYCPPGTHGDACELSCPDNCQNKDCDARSGACLRCVSGYMGDFCDQVCEPGIFGPNCSRVCSKRCAKPCHHITGLCTCQEVFAGELCKGLYSLFRCRLLLCSNNVSAKCVLYIV
ncbi:unnamed protein product, partial [Candidula unifasciata]